MFTYKKNNLTELKGFTSPPSAVVKVAAAVMVLMANESGKIPKDRSWKSAKTMMSKVIIKLPRRLFLYMAMFDVCVGR